MTKFDERTYIVLTPRTAIIPFRIEMPLIDFLRSSPQGIAHILKRIEYMEKVIIDKLYKEEVEEHDRKTRRNRTTTATET